jgi:hypothetical protein
MAYQYCSFWVCSGGTEVEVPLRIALGNPYINQNGTIGDCYVQTQDRAMTMEYNWNGGGAYNFDVSMRLQWDFQQTYTGHPNSNYQSYSVYTIPAGTRLKTFFIEVYHKSECPCGQNQYDYPVPV